ncbi:hypothetical protein, partial [Glaesserella parasuis]|uniref:hypothetical protein n=1 Tax=Glaesserella parasuis TaxID=738 RepID=UPI0038541B71
MTNFPYVIDNIHSVFSQKNCFLVSINLEDAGQPHMLSIFQPTRRATAHLEIHLTNRQRSISL